MDLKENQLYEIFLCESQGDDGYDVGFFIAQDEDFIVFQSVNVNGFDDGFLLLRKEAVLKLQYNTKYCVGLNKLIEYRQTKLKKVKFGEANLIDEVLKYAKDNRAIVEIALNNSGNTDLLGFIENFSDDFITTLEVDYDGQADGNALAKINDITRLSVNAYKRLKYKILFEINYQTT